MPGLIYTLNYDWGSIVIISAKKKDSKIQVRYGIIVGLIRGLLSFIKS